MPEIGEIQKAGGIKKSGTSHYIWWACPECGVERWWEQVHHKGTKYPIGSKEDKADNRIENLELTSEEDHPHLRYNGQMITCPFCSNKIKISPKLFH